MKRFVALATVAVFAFALASVLTATAASEDNSNSKSTPHAKPAFACTAQGFRPFSEKVWRLKAWERGKPKESTIAAKGKRLHCAASNSHRKAMENQWAHDKARFLRYAALRHVAPYPGEGTWWAIPYVIVTCESGTDRWLAANPSGAVGPYQLLNHGAPYPADTWQEKMENHRIARDLYLAEGTSPWVSSIECWG